MSAACVLNRYADVSAALRDQRLSAASARSEAPAAIDDENSHRRMRQLAMELFPPAKIADWRPDTGRFGNSPLDLVNEIAAPWGLDLAVKVTGAKSSDAPLAEAIFAAAREPFDDGLRANAERATLELIRRFPGEAGPLLLQAFVALSQSLPCFLGNAWLALLEHPAEFSLLAAQPELMSKATEELLRFAGPARAQLRRAVEDLEIGGAKIVRGRQVILMLVEANRDPEQFPDPDRLDLARTASGHVAFGAGPHACVGAPLVRMAASIAIRPFADRFANAELNFEAQTKPGFATRSLRSLVVRPLD